MYLRRTLGLGLAVVTAATILITAAGAGTGHLAIAKIDLSTNADVAKYLRSIHVNPKGVVIQRGVRNYAGPRCPGKGWNCTKAQRVVQVGAAPAGETQLSTLAATNKFSCTTPTCVVVQSDATNQATVKQQTGVTQLADITQTGTTNSVNIVQLIQPKAPNTFEGRQKALVAQHAPNGGSNTASVNQGISENGNVLSAAAIVQDVKGDQFIKIGQDGLNGAFNTANTSQSLTEDMVARTTGATTSITQDENSADLDGSTPLNTSSVVDQDSDTGPNSVVRSQTHKLKLTATAKNGAITQTQGSAVGGLDASSAGAVHQQSLGVSKSENHQSETQQLFATTNGPVSQTQTGPVRCCSEQQGNANNTFTDDQTSTLTASDPNADQQSFETGDLSSSGNTSLNQTISVDGQTTTSSCSSSDCSSTISGGSNTPPSTSISNTDVAEFGFGGMRGGNNPEDDGVGSINVTGVTGTVTKALLYWNGPTNSSDPGANASVTFAGTPITGTNIGFSGDNCWGFANSQSYRADVTSLVTGNGTYSLSNFRKPPDVEINGVALFVFYNDADTGNDRNVVMFNGNDSNFASSFDGEGWDQTIPNVPYPDSGSASLDFVVSDGQAAADDALVLNGGELAPAGPNFQGSTPGGDFDAGGAASGSLWDVKSFDITSFLSPGSNNLRLTTGLGGDCLSLVVAAANVPA